MQILVADDNETFRLHLRLLLEAKSHVVTVADNGDRAWQLIRDGRFSVVISDWMMPGMDGPSLCRRIRSSTADYYTYVMLITALSAGEGRMAGLRAGADDFLSKPIDAEELSVRLEVARRFLDVQSRWEQQNAYLVALSTTDELTGVKNRREFRRALDAAFGVASRQGLPLSLLLLDVDHFKEYNDAFGHLSGDEALRGIGDILSANCREHEIAARYGGEEFAVILLGATAAEAHAVAERLRAGLAGREWAHRPITASFGIATSSSGLASVSELIDRADRALYRSKRRGRDRISHFDDLSVTTALGADSRLPEADPDGRQGRTARHITE